MLWVWLSSGVQPLVIAVQSLKTANSFQTMYCQEVPHSLPCGGIEILVFMPLSDIVTAGLKLVGRAASE